MEFSGTFELEGVSPEVAWLVLTDPIAIEKAVPGCEYVRPADEDAHDFDAYEPDQDVATLPEADREAVEQRAFREGESYAARAKIGIGDISPTFESIVTIEEREDLSMKASGRGATFGSEYRMTTSGEVSESDRGAVVEWHVDVDLSGRIAQYNDRVLEAVADKVVNQFADNVQAQIQQVEEAIEEAPVVEPGEATATEPTEATATGDEKPGIVGRIKALLGGGS